MKEDWNSVPPEQRAALEKTMEKMELGDSMNTGSIQKVEVDRFARADLEWKLLMTEYRARHLSVKEFKNMLDYAIF